MAERLSASMRDCLDALVAVGDDDPHSPLHRIKTSPSNPSVGGMKRLLARLELIEATGVLGIDVGWVNGNYRRILFHSVRTASADRVREMAAPRRHLALVCFLHQACLPASATPGRGLDSCLRALTEGQDLSARCMPAHGTVADAPAAPVARAQSERVTAVDPPGGISANGAGWSRSDPANRP